MNTFNNQMGHLEVVNSPQEAETTGTNHLGIEEVEPWHEPVDGTALLDELRWVMKRYVVLPPWGAETLALWVVHTYAFELRNVTAYLGISSPEKRCGKTTLLELLGLLANRAVSAANISPPALFRVIEEARPTLLIDEADTFLHANIEMRGILNSGYTRRMAYVVRANQMWNEGASPESEQRRDGPATSGLRRFSCWCPKAIATIGKLPDTLMDRCVVIAMQRKRADEKCERLRDFDPAVLRRKCARFVEDHVREIASLQPDAPSGLNDRAADIWEPLLTLAEVAGAEWPKLAWNAAVNVSAAAQEANAIGSLLLDVMVCFFEPTAQRIFSRELVDRLNGRGERPWTEGRNGKEIDERWLSRQLRPYGVRPKTIWIGEAAGKGYLYEELLPIFQRYISRAELDELLAEVKGRPQADSESKTQMPKDRSTQGAQTLGTSAGDQRKMEDGKEESGV